MKVKAIDKQIHEIFASYYYVIPRFQRPYSWENDNIIEFWNDTIVDTKLNDDYFIGSIVVYENNGYKGIVDGQQRLTTIIILLCALRDTFKEAGITDYSEGVQNLIERKNIDNKKQFVLKTEGSYPFFQEKILKYDQSDYDAAAGAEELNIQSAYEIFKEKFNTIKESINANPSDNQGIKKEKLCKALLDIRTKILNLKIIFVELDNEDEAYLIFETLNTRGKDLTVTDLLRNFITKNIHCDNPEVDTGKLKWNKILSNIDESKSELDSNIFIHHQWMSGYSYVTYKALFKEIKRRIKGGDVENYLNLLVADSKNYSDFYNTNNRSWKNEEKEIVNSLEAYKIFNVKQHMPTVLSAFRNYDNGKMKLKSLKTIISSMEKFHFIFTAITSSRSTGGMAKMYSDYAIKINRATDSNEIGVMISEFISKLKEKLPSLEEFNINLKEIIYTGNNAKNKHLIKYILIKYDQFLRQSNIIDYKNMSIEHLYSQNMRPKYDDKVLGQIGNLYLVDYKFNNEQLKDKEYKEKKKLLIKGKYPLDEILIKNDKLSEDIINKRTDHIAKIAYGNIWNI